MYVTYAVFTSGSYMRWCATPHLSLAEVDASECYRRWSKKDREHFVRAVVIDREGREVFSVASPMACVGSHS